MNIKTAFIYDDVRVTPDRQIGLHSHHLWELSHVINGAGLRTIGNKSEHFTEGEVILIPPDIPHVWQFDPAVTDRDNRIANITILFESSTLDGLAALFPEFREHIRRIRTLTEALSYSGDTRNAIVSLMTAMRGKTADTRLPDMLRLLSVISRTDNSRSVGFNNMLTRTERKLETIRTFCTCNYARDISLDEAAAHAAMNKSAFCTFMKRHTGRTFSEYMNDMRLRRALERLKSSDDSISAIAYSVGFTNVTYFNRLFRARYGCTPKSVRKEGKPPHTT